MYVMNQTFLKLYHNYLVSAAFPYKNNSHNFQECIW